MGLSKREIQVLADELGLAANAVQVLTKIARMKRVLVESTDIPIFCSGPPGKIFSGIFPAEYKVKKVIVATENVAEKTAPELSVSTTQGKDRVITVFQLPLNKVATMEMDKIIGEDEVLEVSYTGSEGSTVTLSMLIGTATREIEEEEYERVSPTSPAKDRTA